MNTPTACMTYAMTTPELVDFREQMSQVASTYTEGGRNGIRAFFSMLTLDLDAELERRGWTPPAP